MKAYTIHPIDQEEVLSRPAFRRMKRRLGLTEEYLPDRNTRWSAACSEVEKHGVIIEYVEVRDE